MAVVEKQITDFVIPETQVEPTPSVGAIAENNIRLQEVRLHRKRLEAALEDNNTEAITLNSQTRELLKNYR